jgi:hypothetical protein
VVRYEPACVGAHWRRAFKLKRQSAACVASRVDQAVTAGILPAACSRRSPERCKTVITEIENGEKTLSLVLCGGVEGVKFNNSGEVIGRFDQNHMIEHALIQTAGGATVEYDPAATIEALTGGDSGRLQALAEYRRRRASSAA